MKPSDQSTPTPTPTPTQSITPGNQPAARSKKRQYILIAIGLFVLYLGYRIGVGYYYSPEAAYKRDAATVEAKRGPALDETKSIIQKIRAELIRLAPTIPADNLTPAATTSVTRGSDGKIRNIIRPASVPIEQQELKGILTPVDQPKIIDRCVAYNQYSGGSKSDPRPERKIGSTAYCENTMTEYFIWTGSEAKLASLAQQTNTNLKLNINLNDIKYTYPDFCQDFDSCTYMKAFPASNYKKASEQTEYGRSYTWQKSFIDQKPDSAKVINASNEDKRYILQISHRQPYHTLLNLNY